jgi:glucose repression regulatory protein TUP1
MSSMYPGHQGMRGVPPANGGAGRLNELLDQIRAEFESHVRQTETYEHQSKSFPPWPAVISAAAS